MSEEKLFENIGNEVDAIEYITPYLMADNLYNRYDHYDIITKLAFNTYEKYIYVILYDSPTELMLDVLYKVIPELKICLREQPNTSLMFHCHKGINIHITLSLSYLCPIMGNFYELIIRTLHYYQDIKHIINFMEERKRRIYKNV